MKKQWLGIVLTMCLASVAFAQTNDANALRPFDKNKPVAPCNGSCLINYNGGPVFETAPTVYIIWYGNWSAKDKSIIDYYFPAPGWFDSDEDQHHLQRQPRQVHPRTR